MRHVTGHRELWTASEKVTGHIERIDGRCCTVYGSFSNYSDKAESTNAKGPIKAWQAALHDLYGCPLTLDITIWASLEFNNKRWTKTCTSLLSGAIHSVSVNFHQWVNVYVQHHILSRCILTGYQLPSQVMNIQLYILHGHSKVLTSTPMA